MGNGSSKKTFAPRSWLQIIVPCVLLALVGVLAVLQYRWVGQFSDAERQRMRTSAQEHANRFADDFDTVLTSLFLAFSVPATEVDPVDYTTVCAQQYRQWLAGSAHPHLVRMLYLARTTPTSTDLLQLTAAGTFQPATWPPELEPIRPFLPGGGGTRPSTLFGTTAPEIPALLIPLNRLQVTDVSSDPARMRIVNLVGLAGFVIAVIDRDYVGRQWLPALARHYFPDADGDYNVAVVQSTPQAPPLYVSSPNLNAAAFAKPDVTAPLFRIRFEQAARLLPNRPSANWGPSENVRFTVATRHETTIVAAGSRSAEWQLRLAHRAGSLEAAVARSRRRNLAVSFGILGVLAVSLGLIVLSARRAARLARQQVEFVAGVSHELRTPLTVIRSAGENLSDGVISDPAQVKRYGTMIADEGRRLSDLVEQVMSFAGFEAGRELQERADVDVADLIEEVIARAHPVLAQQGFTLDRCIAPTLPRIRVNVAGVTRAIENLIANAVKYSGTSRWIGIAADAAVARRGREVRITVEDRGVGIRPDEQRHVFEPFYRGRDVVASTIRGSGLGLSLARRIIEAHGGSISVRSAPGQGSAFTLHVPCVETGEPT